MHLGFAPFVLRFTNVLLQAQAEKLYFESDKIKKGIVELVSLHGIRSLVMGAAADKYYSRYTLATYIFFPPISFFISSSKGYLFVFFFIFFSYSMHTSCTLLCIWSTAEDSDEMMV